MEDYELGVIESRFADIIWEHQPMTTRELVKLCAEKLEWKRTTTYTILKKLCDKGFFKLEDRMVTALVTKEEYKSFRSRKFVDQTFHGSLSAFVLAFGSQEKLSDEEIQQLREAIDQLRG